MGRLKSTIDPLIPSSSSPHSATRCSPHLVLSVHVLVDSTEHASKRQTLRTKYKIQKKVKEFKKKEKRAAKTKHPTWSQPTPNQHNRSSPHTHARGSTDRVLFVVLSM